MKTIEQLEKRIIYLNGKYGIPIKELDNIFEFGLEMEKENE